MSGPSGTPTPHYAIPTFADTDLPDLANVGGGGLTSILQAIDSAIFGIASGATYSANPSSEATTSASEVMAGFAGSITPKRSGIVLYGFSGQVTPLGTVWGYRLRHGTGSAPANGAAATGTTDTNLVSCANGTPGGFFTSARGFALIGLTTLVKGTTYWLDLGIFSDGSNAATFLPAVFAIEL